MYSGKLGKMGFPDKNRILSRYFPVFWGDKIFFSFDPIIGLLDLKLVQLDTNFIKIGQEMAKIDRGKMDEIGHFWHFYLSLNLAIFIRF